MSKHVKVDLRGIEKKMNPATFNRVRRALAERIVRDSSPYVPFKDGGLEGSDGVTSDGGIISWDKPYARAQYKGRVGRKGTPVRHYSKAGTGKEWVEKAKRNNISSWKEIVKRGMV